MTQQCPRCQGIAYVLRSRRHSNGSRTRRYQCSDLQCRFRWNVCDGVQPKRARVIADGRAPLTTDQVRVILEQRDLSLSQLSVMFDRSRQAISNVRTGKSYTDVLPDLERWGVGEALRSCLVCHHWRDSECFYGFPDPLEEGPGFARYCDDYQRR
jgi:hypothetical protein